MDPTLWVLLYFALCTGQYLYWILFRPVTEDLAVATWEACIHPGQERVQR
jgi:hypothetical protein